MAEIRRAENRCGGFFFLHTKCNIKKCRRRKALTAFFTYYFELFLCGSILFLIIGNEAKLKIFAA